MKRRLCHPLPENDMSCTCCVVTFSICAAVCAKEAHLPSMSSLIHMSGNTMAP